MCIWKFGDHINTDLITPGRYNLTQNPAELAKICFIEHRPEFAKNVKSGDVVAAGENFGCGSSRETAVTALKATGVQAVLAKSFARIFYRNAINQGFLVIEMDTRDINDGDAVHVDLQRQEVHNLASGSVLHFFLPKMQRILIEEGGISAYLKKYGLQSIENLV